MSNPRKTDLIKAVRTELKSQYERLSAAAKEAHDYATDPDSKAESKYDTRSLEASYLATGQSEKADELAEAIRYFRPESFPAFEADQPADLGAIVRVEYEDRSTTYFLMATRAGGISGDWKEDSVTIITPTAPLFQKLRGKRAGDELPDPPLTISAVL